MGYNAKNTHGGVSYILKAALSGNNGCKTKNTHKGVTIRETGVGEKRTPVFLSFMAILFRLGGLEILLLFF